MDYIVVYDKKAPGNPIVAIHSQRFRKERVDLHDIHPEDDSADRGVMVVPGDIIRQMTLRKFRKDEKGGIKEKSLYEERRKELTSIFDTSLEKNILIFAEPVTKLVAVEDLASKTVRGELIDDARGIIDIGDKSGLFTVTCLVDTGFKEPEVLSEKKNWKWNRDKEGNIIGMRIIKKADTEP